MSEFLCTACGKSFTQKLSLQKHFYAVHKVNSFTCKECGKVLKTKNPMDCMRASESLAKKNSEHHESHLAIISAALEAKLWGEARKYLKKIRVKKKEN